MTTLPSSATTPMKVPVAQIAPVTPPAQTTSQITYLVTRDEVGVALGGTLPTPTPLRLRPPLPCTRSIRPFLQLPLKVVGFNLILLMQLPGTVAFGTGQVG